MLSHSDTHHIFPPPPPQVSVRFEVIPDTATPGQDYSISSSDVILGPGEDEKRVPIEIINDPLPEIAETFTVRLVPGSTTGGAVLGLVTETQVTILESDDPNGAFGRCRWEKLNLV